MKNPLPPLFQILSTLPHFPITSNPNPHCSFCCSVSLAEWVSHHIWCAIILLNDNMNLHMSSQYLKDLDVCFMQQGLKSTEVWHNVIFYLYSDLIPHTHTHTVHSGASRQAHPYEHISTPPPVMMIKWIIHWYQKSTFHSVFSF